MGLSFQAAAQPPGLLLQLLTLQLQLQRLQRRHLLGCLYDLQARTHVSGTQLLQAKNLHLCSSGLLLS